MAHVPVVFISSTSDDLKDHRVQAEMAAKTHEFYPRMMEYFPANGSRPSLQACREEVEKAEVVVVLVAHRYGWVPDDPTNKEAKSITWLECEHAWNFTGKEVLAFLVDPSYKWPLEFREDFRLIAEQDRRGIKTDVKRNEKKLAEFKKKLSGTFRGTFTDPASVRALVGAALSDWRRRNLQAMAAASGDAAIHLTTPEEDAINQAHHADVLVPAAMVFVDVMRMLYTMAAPQARAVSVHRFAEFIRIAEQHWGVLRTHITLYATMLPPPSRTSAANIDRRLSGLLSKCNSGPDLSVRELLLALDLARKTASTIEELGGRLPDYLASRSDVHRLAMASNPATIDECFSVRLHLQNQLLRARTDLQTIADDMDLKLALGYFAIDHELLRQHPEVFSNIS